MTDYTTAAKQAQTELAPLLEADIQSTKNSLTKTEQKLTQSGVTSAAMEIIDKALRPSLEQAARVVAQFCSMTAQGLIHDGHALINVLASVRRSNEINDEQARDIALALLGEKEGNQSSGLISWPDEPLNELLNTNALVAWAQWIDPDAWQKVTESQERAAADAAHLTVVLREQQKALDALNGIIPAQHKRSTLINVRNNGERKLSLVAGAVVVAPGDAVEIKSAQMVELHKNDTHMNMFKSGELEVVA